MNRAILLALAMCITCFLRAQDPHFSQFFFSPQKLNPASIGDMDARYRINANQKTQWKSVSRPYSTFALMGDGVPDFLPEDFAVGLLLLNDNAGDSKLNTFGVLLGSSYDLPIFHDDRHGLRAGIQVGMSQIKLDESALSFDKQYNGVVYDPQLPTGEQLDRNARWFFNLNLGLNYRYTVAAKKQIRFGLAAHNVSAPQQSFYNEVGVRMPFRFSAHATAVWELSERMNAMPALRYMRQGQYSETIVGSALRYVLLEERNLYRSVFAGYFGRLADSGIALAGVEVDDWRVAASYDINVSDLKPASRNRGGFELSLQYLFGRDKSIAFPLHRQCPDFL